MNDDRWGVGERVEAKRRNLLKALVNARKELSENGKVTEELKAWLQALTEEAPDSETKEEAVNFLEMLPDIEGLIT